MRQTFHIQFHSYSYLQNSTPKLLVTLSHNVCFPFRNQHFSLQPQKSDRNRKKLVSTVFFLLEVSNCHDKQVM